MAPSRCWRASTRHSSRPGTPRWEDSAVAGELLPVAAVSGEIGDRERGRIHAAVRERIASTIASRPIDVVHLHGIDFADCLPPSGPPVIVTLHMPLDSYPPAVLVPGRPGTFLHPVSASQAGTAPPGTRLSEPIENGIQIPRIRARRRGLAVVLGRICPEKGQDDALDAAARAFPCCSPARQLPNPASDGSLGVLGARAWGGLSAPEIRIAR